MNLIDRENMILNSVLILGKSSTSFLITYPGYQYFEYLEGSHSVRIAYVNTRFSWVGASEPLGPEDYWENALSAFRDAARKESKVILLLPVSAKTATLARKLNFTAIQIGQEPWFRMQNFHIPKIAKQLLSKGVSVGSFNPAHISAKERFELKTITDNWLSSRKYAPLDFLNQVKPWIHFPHKRYFRVIHNDHQLGYVSAIPIPMLKAWYLVDLIRAPTAPLGTTELLISAATEALAKEGYALMTLGMAPFVPVGAEETPHHPKLYKMMSLVFEKLSFFYNFKSLFLYKQKLRPDYWEPLYLITSEKRFGIRSAMGISEAMFSKGIMKTSFHTVLKILKTFLTAPKMSRFLSDDLVVRSVPNGALALLMRLKITSTILVTNCLLFIVSTTNDFTLRDYSRDRFKYTVARFLTDLKADDLRALILHSFLHWNLFHLLFNMSILLVGVGYLELIAGSNIVLLSYVLGILFSNPLISIILQPILGLIDLNLLNRFIHESDVGCSLGVFAGLGTLAYFLKKPSYFLVFLTVATLLVSVLNSSILGLNHLAALGIGYWIGKKCVRKHEF